MTKIYYNNLDVFSGLAPTPLVQLSEEPVRYGNLWSIAENITLNGQLTGQCETFQQLLDKQSLLISYFSTSFKSLKIDEDGNNIYTWPLAKVKNISFDPSKYSTLLDFSISLECYDSGKFSGYYGVLEPVNEISYSESENGLVNLTHKCSAKGINTNESATGALLNAKNYVSTISGWSNISGFSPAFISGNTGQPPVLIEIQETIDRFNNIYSINETWSYDPQSSGYGLFRYTNSIGSGIENGTIEVTLNGDINGGKNISLSNIRNRFDSINKYDLASGALLNFSTEPLNNTPINLNITESSFENKITFSYTYDNNPESNPYLIDSVTINDNKNGRSSVSFRGTFKYRGSCLCNGEAGWTALESMVNNFDYFSYVSAKWSQYGKTSLLSSYPSSTSISKNRNTCEITVERSFDEIFLTVPSELEYIDVSLNVIPSINQYDAKPVFSAGLYYITNLGFKNRAKYSLQGAARIKTCINQDAGIQVIKNYINTLAGRYVIGSNTILEQGEITESESDNKLINFNFTWSAMGAEFTV